VTGADAWASPAEADGDGESAAFGLRVRRSREAKDLTLDRLAAASQVSRAMLSRIERGEANPTIGVAKRIAKALDTSLSFLAGATVQGRAVVTTREHERAVFRDPVTGFERHLLSPPSAGTGIELVLHVLPPAATTGMLPAPASGTEKHVVVLAGELEVDVDGRPVRLGEGDTLFFEADGPHAFTSTGPAGARYLVFISRRNGVGP
jgi:transcriptional regulator with XRE-family HTH domain